MAINKKLIHFGAKANFEKELAAGNILDTSIVFIKDAKLIWTHGQYYGSDSISSEIEDRLNNIETVIEDNELTTANALIELKKTKADLSDSLSGYGILDAYTKEEIDNKNFYTKPSTGISITDLEESVRTSLENADSYKGTVTGVKLNGTTNIPSEDGTVDLGTIKLNLDSSYIPAVYPEDTGDGEFAELTPGESLDSAIKKLDQNLVNVVGEILDNEEVMAQALTALNDSKTTLEEVESIYLRKENLPTSLKNPYKLTIKKNSTTLADYDGSSSKMVDLSFNSGEISIDYNYNTVEYGGNISFSSISPGETLSTSLNTLENNISGLAGKVADNEEVISAALTDLNDRKVDRDEVESKTAEDILISDSYESVSYPEIDTDSKFLSIESGNNVELAFKKVEENLSDLIQFTIDNELATSTALSKINEKLDSEKIISDDPQPTGFSIGGNTVYKKLISLEYTNVDEETEWRLPCSTDTTGVNLIDMSLIITQLVDGFDGSISFDYRDYYFINKNSNQVIYFYDHNNGNIVIRFKSSKQTNLLGTITFSTSSVVSGGDSADITNEDIIEGGTSI